MVTRHRAMADGTQTDVTCGAASPERKPALPASEVVRELLQRRRGHPRTPSCSAREKREGTQVPRCSQTQWRRCARRLLRSCCGNYSTRTGSSCSRIFPQHSFRLGLATLAQRLVDYSLFSPSGCGCHCATPFLRRVRCRCGSQTKKQWLFPYCSLSSVLLRPIPRDAFHRFTALSGHWPFAGDIEASDCQPMPLRVGIPESAYSIFKKRSRSSCSSSSNAVRVRRFLEAVSSVYTPVLAELSVLLVHGRQGAEGRWQWSPLVAILCTAQPVQSG